MRIAIRSSIFLSVASLLLTAVSAVSQPINDSLLNAYIQESWNNHPDLEGMRSMIAAENSRTRMNGAWMNPELRFGLMNVPENFDTHMDPNTMWQVSVMQQVPFPGKKRAATETGKARIVVAQANWDETRQQMASMVAMSYYELAGLMSERKSMLRGKDQIQQMIDATLAMNISGMGTQSDILRAKLELEQWNVKLVSNQSMIDQKRAELLYAIGRDSSSQLSDPVLPDSLPPQIDLQAVLDADVLNETPTLKKAQSEAKAAQSETRRAKLDYYPDVNVGLSYGFKGYLRSMVTDPVTMETTNQKLKQDGMISIELSAPVPLFYRGNQEAKVREMSAIARNREADLTKARLQKEQQLREIYIRMKEVMACCNLAQASILPRAKSLWESTLNDYRAGKVPFMSLSQAQMNVVMAEMENVMHRADAWGLLAQWYAALGEADLLSGVLK